MSSRSGQAGQSDAGQVAAQRKRKMEQMLCGCASRSTAAERAVAARLQTGATKRVAAIVLDTDGEEWNGSISRAAMQKIFKFLVKIIKILLESLKDYHGSVDFEIVQIFLYGFITKNTAIFNKYNILRNYLLCFFFYFF